MAEQRDKGGPSRAIAEQPTHPVDLDHVAGASQPRGQGVESGADDGPTLAAERRSNSGAPTLKRSPARRRSARRPRGSSRAGARGGSRTQSGMMAVPAGRASAERLGDGPSDAEETGPSPRIDESTQAIDAVTAGPGPTSSLPWPGDDDGAPGPGAVVGERYTIASLLSEGPGYRRYLARTPVGGTVVIRTYTDPGSVWRRPAWQALCEAFAQGAALPDLLRVEGVVPLIDLVDDPRYGPVVVTASLRGGTLSARAAEMSVDQLASCFERIAGVLMSAHAQGVTVGRMTPDDVDLDREGAPNLDLSVAAFSDALDVSDAYDLGAPSPADDIGWLGSVMQACLPQRTHDPRVERLAAVARNCIEGQPRPTAAEVHERLRAMLAPPAPTPARPRWPPAALLSAGVLLALAGGWVAGGGLSSHEATGRVAVPQPTEVTRALEEARAALEAGAWLDAGRIYREVLAEANDAEARRAWDRLRRARPFRVALKDLKKRLAVAEDLTQAVERDIEMLRILQPESPVLKHWLRRMADRKEALHEDG